MSQNSVPLQKLPSSCGAQSLSTLQPQVFVPLTHLPTEQVSPVVQPLPSSQLAVLLALTQPSLVSQESVVHGLLSSHNVAGFTATPLHAPPAHASLVVHALPSSQVTVLAPCRQPLFGSQLSLVQTFASSQPTALPTQLPAAQVSAWLQALPSSQLRLLFANAHLPVATAQLSEVQGLLSLHVVPAPDTQPLVLHTSPTVHALPSLHGAVLAAWVQPSLASQPSSLQPLPSSQFNLPPGWQAPALHASLAVHTLPSASQLFASLMAR